MSEVLGACCGSSTPANSRNLRTVVQTGKEVDDVSSDEERITPTKKKNRTYSATSSHVGGSILRNVSIGDTVHVSGNKSSQSDASSRKTSSNPLKSVTLGGMESRGIKAISLRPSEVDGVNITATAPGGMQGMAGPGSLSQRLQDKLMRNASGSSASQSELLTRGGSEFDDMTRSAKAKMQAGAQSEQTHLLHGEAAVNAAQAAAHSAAFDEYYNFYLNSALAGASQAAAAYAAAAIRSNPPVAPVGAAGSMPLGAYNQHLAGMQSAPAGKLPAKSVTLGMYRNEYEEYEHESPALSAANSGSADRAFANFGTVSMPPPGLGGFRDHGDDEDDDDDATTPASMQKQQQKKTPGMGSHNKNRVSLLAEFNPLSASMPLSKLQRDELLTRQSLVSVASNIPGVAGENAAMAAANAGNSSPNSGRSSAVVNGDTPRKSRSSQRSTKEDTENTESPMSLPGVNAPGQSDMNTELARLAEQQAANAALLAAATGNNNQGINNPTSPPATTNFFGANNLPVAVNVPQLQDRKEEDFSSPLSSPLQGFDLINSPTPGVNLALLQQAAGHSALGLGSSLGSTTGGTALGGTLNTSILSPNLLAAAAANPQLALQLQQQQQLQELAALEQQRQTQVAVQQQVQQQAAQQAAVAAAQQAAVQQFEQQQAAQQHAVAAQQQHQAHLLAAQQAAQLHLIQQQQGGQLNAGQAEALKRAEQARVLSMNAAAAHSTAHQVAMNAALQGAQMQDEQARIQAMYAGGLDPNAMGMGGGAGNITPTGGGKGGKGKGGKGKGGKGNSPRPYTPFGMVPKHGSDMNQFADGQQQFGGQFGMQQQGQWNNGLQSPSAYSQQSTPRKHKSRVAQHEEICERGLTEAMLTPSDVEYREHLLQLMIRNGLEQRTIDWFMMPMYRVHWPKMINKIKELDRRADGTGRVASVKNPSAWMTKYFNTLRIPDND